MAPLTLQPFLAVPGQIPPVPWTSWISLFESYVARSRCEEKVDLLRQFLGAGGRRVLLSLPGPTGTYEAIMAALSSHYQAREDAEKAREDAEKAGGDKDKPHTNNLKKNIIAAATVGTALLTGIGALVAAPIVLAGVGLASAGIAAGAAVGGIVGGATAGVITSLNSTSDDKKEPGEEDKDADTKKQS